MKKLLAILGVTLIATTASAGCKDGQYLDTKYGYKQDNGIFAFNQFEFYDPRWYSQEFTNMVNEFDDELDDRPFGYRNIDNSSHSFYVSDNVTPYWIAAK
jgi:hypothetical protein